MSSIRDAFETVAIHAGQEPDPLTGAVVHVDGKPSGLLTRQDVLTFLAAIT